MQKKTILWSTLLLSTVSYATTPTLQVSYEILDFDHSRKKDNGVREGVRFQLKQEQNFYQVAYEHTHTDTFQPPLDRDLKVDKYYVNYTRELDSDQSLSLSYATIDDNLMEQTDGGDIYGLGYRYKAFSFKQYFSDYKHFDVYQSEAGYTIKKQYQEFKTSLTLIEKYIHLEDKESNNFSKNAKTDYFTTGIKLHAHYQGYQLGVGTFLGKRIFAVMNNGFKVQHHAMEFDKTYMCGIGKAFKWGGVHLKYVYQEATEVPIHNEGVTVQNLMMQVGYKF